MHQKAMLVVLSLGYLVYFRRPIHCCYGGIENDFDFFGPSWSLHHENLEKLIKSVAEFEILPTRAFHSTVFLLLIWAL